MIKSNRGQLSIFMGITLIIVIGMLAFIINVGLFVKAKINLQNATDAAAFAGAATQARQLTNIAYANWELRNTYKEWMFKYYVLGQLGLLPYNLSNLSSKSKVHFLLETPGISGFQAFDKYNIPSICIHNRSRTNICPIFALPGIPRFPTVGVAGIAEITDAFVDTLVSEKAKDCSRRSKANFLTALTWAYGSGTDPLPEVPLVATNRPGAWPQALELAFRIRNLEMIMNRPPVADMSLRNISQLGSQAPEISLNERPMKAFWSAYRNLGGGTYKDNNTKNGVTEELSLNLVLTELSPLPYSVDEKSVSGFLIPSSFVYPGGSGNALQKYYVDLELMTVNLATMFSTFVSTSNNNAALGVQAEATCGISKSALPVPGYILGFNKNPEVITYYAVKAESKFIGLFYPLADEGIKLTAYAAAKPFGGRIGPKLFNYMPNRQTVIARSDNSKRSAAYINGVSIEAGGAGFQPGMPIPSSSNFWVNNINPVIGGVPGTAATVFFGIPNMIYDFQNESELILQSSSSGDVQLISPLLNPIGPNGQASQTLGLYHRPQYAALLDSLAGIANPGVEMTGDEVLKAIVRARRPTRYDVINYLVPDFREVSEKNNAAPMIQRLNPPILNVGFHYKLFAPLLGPNLLYKNKNDVESVVQAYLDANSVAVGIYLKALLDVANNIYNIPSQGDTKDAARSIHVNAGTGNPTPSLLVNAPASSPDCKQDMASKFHHFFRGTQTGCEIVPLSKLMVDFIEANSANDGTTDRSLYYIGEYYNEPSNAKLHLPPEQQMTAYFPSTRQGASPGDQAIVEHPLGLPTETAYSSKRNYYSTKFFQLAKIIDSPQSGVSTRGRVDYQDQPALKESITDSTSADLSNLQIKNYLKYDQTTGINNIYFLDF